MINPFAVHRFIKDTKNLVSEFKESDEYKELKGSVKQTKEDIIEKGKKLSDSVSPQKNPAVQKMLDSAVSDIIGEENMDQFNQFKKDAVDKLEAKGIPAQKVSALPYNASVSNTATAPKRIKITDQMRNYKLRNYTDMEAILTNAGFTNIHTENLLDLSPKLGLGSGKVKKVLILGKNITDFKTSLSTNKIIIQYHGIPTTDQEKRFVERRRASIAKRKLEENPYCIDYHDDFRGLPGFDSDGNYDSDNGDDDD